MVGVQEIALNRAAAEPARLEDGDTTEQLLALVLAAHPQARSSLDQVRASRTGSVTPVNFRQLGLGG